MSDVIYIAASKKLPTGAFGQKQSTGENRKKLIEQAYHQAINKEKGTIFEFLDVNEIDWEDVEVYDSWEDAAGIYVSEIDDKEIAVKQVFKNPFVYRLGGTFYFNEKMKEYNMDLYRERKKEFIVLIDYLYSNIEGDEFIELYNCEWGDWTRKPRRITEIDLSTFILPNEIDIRMWDYIVFKKSKDTDKKRINLEMKKDNPKKSASMLIIGNLNKTDENDT